MKRSQLQQKFTHLIRFSVCLNLTSVVPLAVKPIAVGHNQSIHFYSIVQKLILLKHC